MKFEQKVNCFSKKMASTIHDFIIDEINKKINREKKLAVLNWIKKEAQQLREKGALNALPESIARKKDWWSRYTRDELLKMDFEEKWHKNSCNEDI